MKKIAVTGLSGVIGSIFTKELNPEYKLIDLYHNKPNHNSKFFKSLNLDLLNIKEISKVLSRAEPDVIIHMAAITHIDRCELDRERGKSGIVWKVNVEATKEIAKFSFKNNVPLLFLSTECVFDGEQEFFSENSKKGPKNWYGVTKSIAEDEILSIGGKPSILRSVVAYHSEDEDKTLYGKILKELKEGRDVNGVIDQKFTPTYSFDIVNGVKKIIDDELSGIFHVAPKKNISPYNFAKLVAKKNNFPLFRIKKRTLDSLYSSVRANLRLRNSSLDSSVSRKILKFVPRTPNQAL